MKKIVLYGLVVLLFLSVVQFYLSNAFAGKIDYKRIFKMSAVNATRETAREQRGERIWGFRILLMQSGRLL